MNWNLSGDKPIWMQLHEQLTQRIATGIYPKGSRMPAVRELAAEAGVNPNTMQRALAQLETDGLVITNRTSGRTVTEDGAVLSQIWMRLATEKISPSHSLVFRRKRPSSCFYNGRKNRNDK